MYTADGLYMVIAWNKCFDWIILFQIIKIRKVNFYPLDYQAVEQAWHQMTSQLYFRKSFRNYIVALVVDMEIEAEDQQQYLKEIVIQGISTNTNVSHTG